MKKNFCCAGLFLTVLCCCLLLSAFVLPPAAAAAEEPVIGAAGALLLDAETGCVLWEQNGYELLEPASTTKILTALVTLDMQVLQEETTVSPETAAVGESSANLQPGEVFTVENLLKGALVKSANDACFALGEAVAGSEPLFVSWMEMKAAAVGAYDAELANTNGLPAENHFLSAYDLALIARADLQKELFREIVRSQYIKMEGGSYTRTFKNTNKLLFADEYVIGIKTGTTDNAGACLVSAMARDGRTVIAVVLHSPDRYGESLRLLNYGIENFINVKYIAKDERIGYCPLEDAENEGVFVKASCSGIYTVEKENSEELRVVYNWRQDLPRVEAGDVLGTAVLKQGNESLQYVNLLAAESGEYSRLSEFWENLSSGIKRIFVR
ncbi:MAG: D-alanyl-D-alanine carboxypeptidase family protein [Bacillota bacterium]|jgi:D-alanyl-D-alanine carboxypeptidase (penicillin-binding protein 5/6)